MSKYPRDEFDKVPESSARQGVHRERLIPARSNGLGLLITVGVLALIVGLAAYFVLPRLGIGASAPAPAESPTAAAAEESPTADAGATPEGTEAPETGDTGSPAADPEPTGEPAPEPSEEPAPQPDRTQPVVVLNGTTVGGLGASISGRIGQDGWTTAQVGNWQGQPLQGSAVFYTSEEQRINAEALGTLLGIPAVQSPGFDYVTVAAGPGFR
ncbi:hypothetical protein BN1051_03234 [Arthrobacter saudimassiliensis]|uniref:LytR/CpsA/Psr regulator C-terminal domain-containing protein n=1 Tax=Arthrobacter saudimassiliensis TaxID=1461584 RepID=A0A078MWL4_9MICC|nr:hypothetical protein BN1051_03234 [Arthrobacter saudimassiliensis]